MQCTITIMNQIERNVTETAIIIYAKKVGVYIIPFRQVVRFVVAVVNGNVFGPMKRHPIGADVVVKRVQGAHY